MVLHGVSELRKLCIFPCFRSAARKHKRKMRWLLNTDCQVSCLYSLGTSQGKGKPDAAMPAAAKACSMDSLELCTSAIVCKASDRDKELTPPPKEVMFSILASRNLL